MNLVTQEERVQKYHEELEYHGELDKEIRHLMSSNSIIHHAYSASLKEGGVDELLWLKRAIVLLAKDNEIKTEHLMRIFRTQKRS